MKDLDKKPEGFKKSDMNKGKVIHESEITKWETKEFSMKKEEILDYHDRVAYYHCVRKEIPVINKEFTPLAIVSFALMGI